MEVLVLDFGDSYDRSVVGVARDLTEARVMARAYVQSSVWEQRVLDFQYFAVQRHVLGVSCDVMAVEEPLDLGVEA